MLVIARKERERIFIGNDITIVITKIKGKVVQVGIDAPKDTRIVREEVDGKENKAGSQAPRID